MHRAVRVWSRESLDRMGHRKQRDRVQTSRGSGRHDRRDGADGEGYEQQVQGDQSGRARVVSDALLITAHAVRSDAGVSYAHWTVPDAGFGADESGTRSADSG